jgi:hypothetical protein
VKRYRRSLNDTSCEACKTKDGQRVCVCACVRACDIWQTQEKSYVGFKQRMHRVPNPTSGQFKNPPHTSESRNCYFVP